MTENKDVATLRVKFSGISERLRAALVSANTAETFLTPLEIAPQLSPKARAEINLNGCWLAMLNQLKKVKAAKIPEPDAVQALNVILYDLAAAAVVLIALNEPAQCRSENAKEGGDNETKAPF